MENRKVIKVSAKSPVPQLAGSIVICVESCENVELRAVGASAVNQMYKGIASARGTLASRGKDLFIKPGFDEIEEEGMKKTVMIALLIVE